MWETEMPASRTDSFFRTLHAPVASLAESPDRTGLHARRPHRPAGRCLPPCTFAESSADKLVCAGHAGSSSSVRSIGSTALGSVWSSLLENVARSLFRLG